jgi:glyoxylase-like metal-dependent hydrolase (beta-lactamase superfamily II)
LNRYKNELIPKKYNGYAPLERWKTPSAVNSFEVTDFVKDGDVINTGTLSLRVIEMPGHHCPGEICLYDKGILFSGDVWLRDEIYGSSKFREGNKSLLNDSIRILKALKVKKLLPGHII